MNNKTTLYLILFVLVFAHISPLWSKHNVKNDKSESYQNKLLNTKKKKINFQKNFSKEVKVKKQFYLVKNTKSKDIKVKSIRLKDIKSIIKTNSPRLKAQEAKVNQAKSLLKSEIAEWYPTLDLSANGLPQYLNGNNYNNNSVDTSSKQWSSSVSASLRWDFIDPARRPSITAAKNTHEKEKHNYSIILRDINLEALKIYYELQKSIAEIKIAEKALTLSTINLKDSEIRFKSGIGTKFEVLEAKTQLSRDEKLLSQKIGQTKINTSSLAEILNLPPNITPSADSPIKLIGKWSTSLEESIIASYSYRKDLNNLLLDLSINNNNAKAAIASNYPTFSLVNTLTTSASKGQANVVSPNWDNSSSSLSNTIGINATWNVFDGGRARSLYRYNKQKAKEAEYNFNIKRAQIKKETEESFFQLETLNSNIKSSYAEVLSAKEALRLAQLRFKAGITTQREVVNNQRDLTEAEVGYITSITNYNIQISELKRYTGIDNLQSCIKEKIESNENNSKDSIKNSDSQMVKPCQV